ncbi:RDD family protein [Lysobacter sp. A3-1-A15]|uniref:RDD family protein n=1 Tax=Novilysobacter viscosus TaxID=3098602 RepID=UPI002ED7C926
MASDPPLHASAPPAPPLVGWRLLALLYDLFPALALWFLVGAIGLQLRGGEPVHADTPAGWLELLALWGITGTYAVASWRRGGQTLGMRPWRLQVLGAGGAAAGTPGLAVRYAVGTLSLLLAGAGFWWAWIDRDRLTWHDRASGTRLARLPPRP